MPVPRYDPHMRLLFAPLFWAGRVTLWIVFLPFGLWRSLRHGQQKERRKLERTIERATR